MAAAVGKYAASKFMSKQAKKDQANRLEDGRDPYWYVETDKHGRTKKRPKKNAKHYPSYIPLEDRERLNSFRGWAKFMDTALFGQVGASFFVGLVPVAGDFADGGIAFLLVQKYANTISCGLPKKVYAQMMSNITIDIAVGLIPLIGDVADAVFKANVKNLIILEDYLKKVYAPKGGDTPMKQVDGPGYDGVDDGLRGPANKNGKLGGWINQVTGGSKQNKDVQNGHAQIPAHAGHRDDREYAQAPVYADRRDERTYAQAPVRSDRRDVDRDYAQLPVRHERRDRDDYYPQETGTTYQSRR